MQIAPHSTAWWLPTLCNLKQHPSCQRISVCHSIHWLQPIEKHEQPLYKHHLIISPSQLSTVPVKICPHKGAQAAHRALLHSGMSMQPVPPVPRTYWVAGRQNTACATTSSIYAYHRIDTGACGCNADPNSTIAYRSFALGKDRLDGGLIASRLGKAHALRQSLFDPAITTGFRWISLGLLRHVLRTNASGANTHHDIWVGMFLCMCIGVHSAVYRVCALNVLHVYMAAYRLVNGEGDGLPGIVVDVYNSSAVMKLDGAGVRGLSFQPRCKECSHHGTDIACYLQ